MGAASQVHSQAVKNLPAISVDTGSVLGSGRPPREGNGNPLRYSYLGNPMDRGAWQAKSMESQRAGHNLENEQTHRRATETNLTSDVRVGACGCVTNPQNNFLFYMQGDQNTHVYSLTLKTCGFYSYLHHFPINL